MHKVCMANNKPVRLSDKIVAKLKKKKAESKLRSYDAVLEKLFDGEAKLKKKLRGMPSY